MLVLLDLLTKLEHHSFSPTGQAMCIYGDPAYPHRIHLQRPFAQRAGFTHEQQAFNQSMSQARVAVEWMFGDVLTYFKCVDFKPECYRENLNCLCFATECIDMFIWQ